MWRAVFLSPFHHALSIRDLRPERSQPAATSCAAAVSPACLRAAPGTRHVPIRQPVEEVARDYHWGQAESRTAEAALERLAADAGRTCVTVVPRSASTIRRTPGTSPFSLEVLDQHQVSALPYDLRVEDRPSVGGHSETRVTVRIPSVQSPQALVMAYLPITHT